MAAVGDLLEQLSLDEKISLIAGANFWETVPIPRLQIPAIKVSDGPNGARGAEFSLTGPTAACFPAAVAIAATFDHSVARRVGKALAEETKSKGASLLLAPTVCPHRSPRGGRNFESFSEDPLLAGNLATALIQGLQENGVGATIKHYAANETETRRHFVNINADERTLREIYLKPFEIAIKAAKPWAVMTSYSSVNGTHADMNSFLLQTVLRDQWKFEGLVMSDWGGTNSMAASITAGLDLEMPGPPTKRKLESVKSALEDGKLTLESLNAAAKRVLELLVRAGRFDNPTIQPEQSIVSKEHAALIREVGSQGIVLLKNDNNLLPLSKEKLKRIAVVGLAKECLAHGGGSAMVNCHYKVTPFEALETLFAGSAELKYAKGAQILRNLPDFTNHVVDRSGQPGFTITYHNSSTLDDEMEAPKNVGSATYVSFGKPCSGVKFEAEFEPSQTGSHYISINGRGLTKLFINDQQVLSKASEADVMGLMFGGAKDEMCQYKFETGHKYSIRLESLNSPNSGGDGLANIMEGVLLTRLGFMYQNEHEEDVLSAAIDIAKNADVVLAFVGNTTVWETEGRDQPSMALPASGSQDEMISAVAKVNPNTVVVNSTGCPVAMPWLESIPAVLQAWFGGQEAGNSIVDVLFGLVNPSGKLPVSFPRREEDNPTYGNFPGDLQTDQIYYKEGIKIGYRFYDEHPSNVAFPFGFGLSYTKFEIDNTEVAQKVDSVTVRATVKNLGKLTGSEVVQVYIASPISSVKMPVKELASYDKVTIKAGRSTVVEFDIDVEKLAYWNSDKRKWCVEAGSYTVLVGNSSTSVREAGKFIVGVAKDYEP